MVSRHVESLGDYDLGRALGEGATGRVYEATERSTGRRVALKILHADLTRTEAVRQAVAKDLSAVAQIRSPHAVVCHGCHVVEDRVVLSFELLQGESLRARVERGRLQWHEAVTIAIQIGTALQAAHALTPPLLHRDLEPEAVLLTAEGAKVTDFGLAKVLGSVGQTTTATFGNIRYMSPEQIDAWGIDERSDVYCLGLVLYEMVVGRQSVSGTSPRELLNAQCTLPPPPFPPEVAASVPPDLERVVRHLLEKSKDARPASAAEAVRLLQSVLYGQPVTIAAPTAAAASRPSAIAMVPARPSPPAAAKATPVVPIVLGSVAFIALLAVGAGYVLFREPSSPAPALARAEAAKPPEAPKPAAPETPPSAARTVAPPSAPEPTPPPANPAPSPPEPTVTPPPVAPPIEPSTEDTASATTGDEDDEAPEDSDDADAPDAPASEDEAAIAMLVGKHKCAIHWINKSGTCEITRDGDVLKIKGSQGSSGDFFKISGKVRVLSDRTFMVDGTLDSRVSGCCGRRTLSGTFKFKRNGSRRYWRLQDPMRSKICHPTKVCMYYVDIFMK